MNRISARIRRVGARRLSAEQRVWLSRLRHGELAWQQRLVPRQQSAAGSAPERGYDARRVVADNERGVMDALGDAGVEAVRLPSRGVFRPRVVIAAEDAGAALEALRRMPETDGWSVECTARAGRTGSLRSFAKHPESIVAIRVHRAIAAPNGRELTSKSEDIVIEPWARLGEGVERVDGTTHIPGTLHRRIRRRGTLVEYLTPANWQAEVAAGGRMDLPYPHLYDVTKPVDIVYTWVDGDDPAWQERKRLAEAGLSTDTINETATIASRFTSRDELRYSLRSVQAYASWVNHIYIVTDRQVPGWLDTDHPQITVVDHRDIFTSGDVLPVFNSHAIESQLHHIPGLSENYLYLNDDIFFMRPTEPSLFFTGNGQSLYFPSTAPLDIDPPSARDLPVMSAAKRNRELIEAEFGRTVTNKFKHTPHPQLRSVLKAMEEKHPEIFARVAASTFRHPDDLSITAALYHYYAYGLGKAQVGRIRYAYMDIASADADRVLQRLSRRDDLDVLCLNDTNTSASDIAHLDRLLAQFLAERFPVASEFERQTE